MYITVVTYSRGGESRLPSRIIKKNLDVVWLPMKQLPTKDKNDTEINNYGSPFGLRQ